MAFVARTCSAHGRGRLPPSVSPLRRCFASSLDRWQRRCDRLTQLQRRIRFPPPETFSVGGQSWKLPLRATDPLRSPSQQELEYLAGFFDGDGCVSMYKFTGHIGLSVTQSIDSAGVLVHFRSLLGGGISRSAQATGSRKAALKWQVFGSKMVNAAASLGSVPCMKQAQLQIAVGACVRQTDREKVEKELQSLKRPDHMPHTWAECSWSYLAGFFDAEGCITVNATTASLRLQLKQLNPCVLVRLSSFLHQNELESWSLSHEAAGCCSLVCSDLWVCKQTLALLLTHGLQVKRRQAQLALALTKDNHLQTREAISSLNGLHMRYQRLDEDGITRAKGIERLRQRAQRCSRVELVSIQQKLDDLRAEHQLQKLISRCSLLRRDMRRALRQGGLVTLPASRVA